MPFIPHTDDDVRQMLASINVANISQLFDEIPSDIPDAKLETLTEGLSELEVTRWMIEREPAIKPGSCFIGAGAYEHHIPAAVWDIAGRGEFYSAYTPYQPEASQASLQLIYEYQTMMTRLMALDVSNASLYDGATSLVEALLMSVRLSNGKKRRVLVPGNLNPIHRRVLNTFLPRQEIIIEDIPFDAQSGTLDLNYLSSQTQNDIAAGVIAQPNFFGGLEEVDDFVRVTKRLEGLAIAYVNPLAMSLLKPPGEWGDDGVDIACGEGQPLGVPLASGGPYFGFICCRKEHVRQMPGRIVGRTNDAKNRVGYVLTLQAREQHIRRAKATSNICTNQGLMVTAATIYMSLLGGKGLRDVAVVSHQNAVSLCQQMAKISGVKVLFTTPYFHEFVLQFEKPVAAVIAAMSEQGIQAGYALERYFPTLENTLLVCVTETKTAADLERYISALKNCV